MKTEDIFLGGKHLLVVFFSAGGGLSCIKVSLYLCWLPHFLNTSRKNSCECKRGGKENVEWVFSQVQRGTQKGRRL